MKIKQLGIVSARVALATLATASAAQAALVVVPPGLNPGDQYRLVFVTDGTRNAQSTDINDYNTFVTSEVTGSTLATALTTAGFNLGTITWKAIASTSSVNARDNTDTNPSSTGVPIYLIDGNRVANDNADLWDGSILTSIDSTPQESGGFGFVWSGTFYDGTTGWAGLGSNVGGINVGFIGSVSAWIDESGQGGSEVYPFYGISTVLTVPSSDPPVSVPEPSSLLGCITLGGLMLGGAVRLTEGGSDT